MKSLLLYFLVVSFPVLSLAQNPFIKQAWVKEATNTYLDQNLFVDPVLAMYLNTPSSLKQDDSWTLLKAGDQNWYADRKLRGSFVYLKVESQKEQTLLLNPKGVKWLYCNNRPLIGNRYQGKDQFESWEPDFGYVRIPVRLNKGENYFLLRCNRGRFKLDWETPQGDCTFNNPDATTPDLLKGESPDYYAGIVLLNQSEEDLQQLTLECLLEGERPTQTQIDFLPALSVFKAAVKIEGQKTVDQEGSAELRLRLLKNNGQPICEDKLILNIRSPKEQHKRTYLSEVDGSVQYYAVKPALEPDREQALVLSVHGANVKATNQAASYHAKNWAHIVAPTNRRPHGYNWEDWGRLDALAVLKEIKNIYTIDPDRIYLTGHSMGGHGTWTIGSTHPDQFAAVGPSAGYLTIGRYYGERISSEERPEAHPLLQRSGNYSLTDSLLRNLRQLGVYVIHGGADRVVPPSQSKRALEQLATFHHDYYYHEEPGQGHWWDLNLKEPGTDCVDWAPLFDFFARRSRPGKERIREINFITASPSISSSNYWATVYRQERHLGFSRVNLRFDPGSRHISGKTENVRILKLAPLAENGKTLSLVLDGDSLQIAAFQSPLYLSKASGRWKAIDRPDPFEKSPLRYAGFKEVVNHRALLVYGTKGNKAERAWARDKALFDAQTFWYQGNGRLEAIPDRLFDPQKYSDRNIILYGNAKTNTAWEQLLKDSPIQIDKRKAQMGDLNIHSEGLAILFIRPRSNRSDLLVGVVGGTDLTGMRLTNTIPYLYQGFALPDYTLFNEEVIGGGAAGILRTGFFEEDWGLLMNNE